MVIKGRRTDRTLVRPPCCFSNERIRPAAIEPMMAESETAMTRSSWFSLAWTVAIVSTGVLMAAPWLHQELAPAGWLAAAGGLMLATGRRGWRTELAVLAAAVLAIALAFHWTPAVLADATRSSPAIGLAFAAPIVLWDACRLALPFFFVGRLVSDPRDAWLPAALVAVVAEGMMPGIFPWKLGYSQLAWPLTVQVADLVGPEGPTFTFVAAAGSLVVVGGLVGSRRWGRPSGVAVAALAVTVANLAYGAFAIRRETARMESAPTLRLALVQVDPDRSGAVDRLRALSRAACSGDVAPDLVCWPECSGGSYEDGLTTFADEDTVFRRSRDPLRGLRPWPEPASPLLFGGRVYRGYRERPFVIFQAVLLLDMQERLVGTYHKRHLMPFGEYVPFANVIPELRLSFPVAVPYDIGGEPTVISCGRARIGSLLCYEDMVPAAAVSLVDRSASLLVSLIHGAAFTNPLTLLQHRLLAQQRAIELRRCLVRCGSTGETCVVDATGRLTQRLPLGIEGFLKADVPLLEGQTPAARLGCAFPVVCGLGILGFMARRRLRRLGASSVGLAL
jgi:apolipoprotein N-acyltransferase